MRKSLDLHKKSNNMHLLMTSLTILQLNKNWLLLKESAQSERDAAQREYDTATDVLDNVHMKGVEDWMVRGPLMRESKTALVISPVMVGVGVLGMAYLMKITQTYRPPAASANKGAAFAYLVKVII